jgi:hypothetical protein
MKMHFLIISLMKIYSSSHGISYVFIQFSVEVYRWVGGGQKNKQPRTYVYEDIIPPYHQERRTTVRLSKS